jgi:hypothetical protein
MREEVRKRVPQSKCLGCRWADIRLVGVLRLDQVIYAIIDIAAKMTPEAGLGFFPLCSGLWLFMLLLQIIIDSSCFCRRRRTGKHKVLYLLRIWCCSKLPGPLAVSQEEEDEMSLVKVGPVLAKISNGGR